MRLGALIVGASPAGAATAYHLREEALSSQVKKIGDSAPLLGEGIYYAL